VASGRIKLEICAPESSRVHMTAQEVHIPGTAGVFTVMPGHTALLSTTIPGVLMALDNDGNEHFFSISKGFVEVRDDEVIVLVDAFETGNDVDIKRAQAALERARERLQHIEPDINVARAELAISRSLARLSAAGKEKYF